MISTQGIPNENNMKQNNLTASLLCFVNLETLKQTETILGGFGKLVIYQLNVTHQLRSYYSRVLFTVSLFRFDALYRSTSIFELN